MKRYFNKIQLVNIKEMSLNNSKDYKRFIDEINDVSDNFHNLRTSFKQDPTNMNIFYFVLIPNDGALSHYPISGRIIRPDDYPQCAPIIHVFNKTGRYNVDIFNSQSFRYNGSSSLCFDILNTAWKSEYTLSTLFGSLMSAIVSLNVEQQSGGFVKEFVTMEKLNIVTKAALNTSLKWKEFLPITPEIPKVIGIPIKCDTMTFYPTDCYEMIKINPKQELKYSYGSFDLQKLNTPLTFKISLADLNLNPNIVFSVVLTNNIDDLVGNKHGTVLIRNGVTATAAKKLLSCQTNWFYHGKPMNGENVILQVTITRDQFTIAYFEKDTAIILGDTAISRLDDIIKDAQKFSLVLYLKNKSNKQISISLPFLNTNGIGYIQDIHQK